MMLQKSCLDQIGVEFHQKVIDTIVNLPTPKRRTIREAFKTRTWENLGKIPNRGGHRGLRSQT